MHGHVHGDIHSLRRIMCVMSLNEMAGGATARRDTVSSMARHTTA